MVDVVRYAEKFEDRDAVQSYTFPTENYRYVPTQRFRPAFTPAVGADYAHDFFGGAPWPKEVGTEQIEGVIWGASGAAADGEYQTMAATLRSIGRGRLFVVDQAGVRRWAWAKLNARPGYQTDATAFANIPVSIELTRFSDWFAAASTGAGPIAVATNYEAFTITNAGLATVKTGFRLVLAATAVGGFSDVIVTNVTTGEQIRWSGSARGIGAELVIDNSDLSIKLQPDAGLIVGGATNYIGEAGIGGQDDVYVDAYPLASLGATQSGFLTLAPGNNSVVIQVGGTAAYTRTHEFYAAWE